MPAGPEGIIKFCVMSTGKNVSLIKDQCIDFHKKNELDSDLWLLILFSTDKVKSLDKSPK